MLNPKLHSNITEGVLTLSLNRPGKLNAIDNEMANAMLNALEKAQSDPAVRAILVRGNGRAFCAGRDISAAPTDDDLTLVQAVALAIVKHPKPVVFAVHGWVVGAGLEWMLDADVVVAGAGARFKLPEASIGVFVTGGISATLAAHAQAWGLVWGVVDDARLDEESLRIAAQLAALAPHVASQFKRVFNQVGLPAFEQAITLENTAMRAILGAR